MTRLLVATTNPAKLAEYRLLLGASALEVVSLAGLEINGAPEEVGAAFAENALLKARFYFARARIPTLADDGGLEIDALGGAPGVRSHRWLGAEAGGDRALAEEAITRMTGVEQARRTARIRAATALVYRQDGGAIRECVAEAALEGVIAPRSYPEIRPGFPYRAVLWLPGRGCYLGELGEAEEAGLSPRRKALEKLKPELLRLARRRD